MARGLILDAAEGYAAYLGREAAAASRARRHEIAERLYAEAATVRAAVQACAAGLAKNDIYGDGEAVTALQIGRDES